MGAPRLTRCEGLRLPSRGKVCDLHDLGEPLVLVATDPELPGIPTGPA